MNFTAFKKLTRIEQTFFGLPFLFSGALLPFSLVDVVPTLRWLWIIPAFMLGRLSGMAFNQLIDCKFDAKNPRTADRPIPSGFVSEKEAKKVAWGLLPLFLLACLQVSLTWFFLAPIAAALFFIYSYLKRFTAACHFVIGLIHFLVPVMASIAIANTILLPALFLGLASGLLFTGTDILYALQDYEFDKAQKLHSIPSRLGVERSYLIARLTHIFSLVSLLALGITGHLPLFYYLVLPTVGWIYYRFHKRMAERLDEMSFFTCGVTVSFTVSLFVVASVVWDAL